MPFFIFSGNFLAPIFNIAPADKCSKVVIPAKAGHVVKHQRYPEKRWMPDRACPELDTGSGMAELAI